MKTAETAPPPRRGRQPERQGGTKQARAPRGARRAADVRGPAPRRSHGPQAGAHAGPLTAPAARPADRAGRPKTADQAKARAKARKAKAPKVVRQPLRQRLRERLLLRLAGVDLRPQALVARIPFVVLVIGALGIGLGITLWLSTDAAQRSYQLSSARSLNTALAQQKEALERDVLQAESAPALADAARNLGMIPSKDTAHLVLDPAGNWVVIGQPKPATGAPPPPLNTKLPDPTPPTPPTPAPGARPAAGAEVPVRLPDPADQHALAGTTGLAPLPGPQLSGFPLPVNPLPVNPGPGDPSGGLTLMPVDPVPGPLAAPAPSADAAEPGAPGAPVAPADGPIDLAPAVPGEVR